MTCGCVSRSSLAPARPAERTRLGESSKRDTALRGRTNARPLSAVASAMRATRAHVSTTRTDGSVRRRFVEQRLCGRAEARACTRLRGLARGSCRRSKKPAREVARPAVVLRVLVSARLVRARRTTAERSESGRRSIGRVRPRAHVSTYAGECSSCSREHAATATRSCRSSSRSRSPRR